MERLGFLGRDHSTVLRKHPWTGLLLLLFLVYGCSNAGNQPTTEPTSDAPPPAEERYLVILRVDQQLAPGRWLAHTLPNAPGEAGVPFELVGEPSLVLTPAQIVHARGAIEDPGTSKLVLHADSIDQDVPQSHAAAIDDPLRVQPDTPSSNGPLAYDVTMEVKVLQATTPPGWIVEEEESGKRYIAIFRYADGTVQPDIGAVYTMWGHFEDSTESDLPVFVVEKDVNHAHASDY